LSITHHLRSGHPPTTGTLLVHNVLVEDELALLTRRFERLHENQVNMRRNTRTCF
jgi:hypothetical protein